MSVGKEDLLTLEVPALKNSSYRRPSFKFRLEFYDEKESQELELGNLDEQEIQQLQKKAKILKENSLNKLNALKTTIQHLSSSNSSMYYEFREAFHRLFNADVGTFKDVLSRNMQNLERQLKKETLHEKDSNSGLSMIKVQFDNFIHSRVLELSNSNSHALEITQDFKAYTNMEAQTFKETIIQNIDVISRLGENTRRNIMDIITTQWCQ
ncbi:hypothetical protein Tco_0027489 [Tanacetum coccineum]